jgi:predicted nucleotidyltransferase component of viral defense system
MDWVDFPFSIRNEWFTGNANITTYHVHELLGTKLRALYQRKKGRDLFDLYYADQFLQLDYDQIIQTFSEYMKFSTGRKPTQKQFLLNLEEKRDSPIFRGDMEGLLRPGISYNQEAAFDWLIENIIGKI